MNNDKDKRTSVKEAFNHWRTTRLRQGEIPDYLMEQVKGLLDDYSLANQNKINPKDAVGIQFIVVKESSPLFTMPSQSEQSTVCVTGLWKYF